MSDSVTSKTQMDTYVSCRVLELWIYTGGELKIYTWEFDRYQQVFTSPTFPQLPILEMVAEVLKRSMTIARSPTLRAFCQQIRNFKS
ncbi:MAG: hypothetical protein SWY16_05170 [Cyanobacteriota bacterium]|nr:hypothetical protein [Cyanobacteriota bacterium]